MTYSNFIFILLTILVFSCQKEENLYTNEGDTIQLLQSSGSSAANFMPPPGIVYSKTELIVQYDASFSDVDKTNMRNHYQVPFYEVCAHCDGTIEKWDFGPGVDIEHKYATAKEDEAEAEGLFRVDREFDFPSDDDYLVLEGSGDVDFSAKIVPMNEGVTIAILDSGVDVNYGVFSDQFLYKAEAGEPAIASGWDYVSEDNNCYDENTEIHGTIVTSIINDYLMSNSIPHQILPIRIADENGKISLFNAYCGISYAAEKADILQMSFGWYDLGEEEGAYTNDIFYNLIEKYDDVLFVTSAGNSHSDNDILAHYPSNYDAPNMIAIAAANESLTEMAYFSNYGALSVDFIAEGTNLPFGGSLVSGTSFSAPVVAAIAAKELYASGMELTPMGIIANLNLLGTPVDYLKPTVYNKILLP